MKTRRKFIELTTKTAITLPLLSTSVLSCKTESKEAPKEELSILILGGTSFLGPHQIAYAIERGHTITIFTRGKTKPSVHADLFDQVEMLIGDRKDNLTALENRKWDVVIDNSGHDVEWTKASAELLKGNVGQYVYTSSTGVYYPYTEAGKNENTELLTVEPDEQLEEEQLEYWYGVMKTNSEQAAREIFGQENTLVIRPTYMIGPADKSNRFIYWPLRLSKGGEVLVPGNADDAIQYVDVRDVAEWTIRLIEEKASGDYNAVGPKKKQGILDFVKEASQAFDVESTFVQVDDYAFLKELNLPYIVPWIMPEGKNMGSALIENAKALKNGLTFRPLVESVKDIYDWWQTLPIEKRAEYEEDPEGYLKRIPGILRAWQNN